MTKLGMTVLAWGNSIGGACRVAISVLLLGSYRAQDLVSNVVVAKQGAPSMAIAACFGGPLFSTLGLAFAYFGISRCLQIC